jgi:flagellar biosynthetic protein FliR
MELLNFSQDQLKIFILILIRVSVVLFFFPLFGSQVIPSFIKVGLAMVLSFVFLPVVNIDPTLFPGTPIDGAILAVSELIMGLILGLTVNLFFAAIQLAGKMVGFQMGFAIVNVLDPQSGMQVSIIDQIGYWVALLTFLGLNGHHMLISALGDSFQLVKLGSLTLQPGLFTSVLSMAADIFSIAVKIGAPAFAALLFTSAAFGISAKFAPQMNILIAAFPVKIIVGLIFFSLSLQIIANISRSFMGGYPRILLSLLAWMGGG